MFRCCFVLVLDHVAVVVVVVVIVVAVFIVIVGNKKAERQNEKIDKKFVDL